MGSILRSYKRNRAKVNMKQLGMTQVCKHSYSGSPWQRHIMPSTFSENWRKLSGGVVKKKKKGDK